LVIGDTRLGPGGRDPVGENTPLSRLLAAINLVLILSRPSFNQGIGPMSQSKIGNKPRRPRDNATRKKSRRDNVPAPSQQPDTAATASAASAPALAIVHPHAAGIDVHATNHVVCVGPQQVETFGAYTADLEAIADHLRRHGVTTVVLESTGVYWVPLFELLERRGFEVFLIEPSQAGHCGARPKTDVLDCQWLQRLHTFGLLRPSFRPPESVLALRGYWRQRQMLVRYAASHVQHMQKALEQMNVKLAEVVSDITGTTGTAIIEAILQGERDAHKLATLRQARCEKTAEEYAQALAGTWRSEHLWALKQAFELYRFLHQQIMECDQQISTELSRLPDRAGDKTFQPRPRGRGFKSNDVRFDAAAPLFKALGVDLTLIDGIDVSTALVILGEIGVDVSRFPTEKHFASWLRLCPRVAESNGTHKKKSKRKGRNRVAQALRMAAQAVSRMKIPLAMFYHRIKGRLGGAGAITATAHKLAVLVYRLLKNGTAYVRQSMEEYAARMREQAERSLRRKATLLGYDLVPHTAANPSPT
jgi:transposase